MTGLFRGYARRIPQKTALLISLLGAASCTTEHRVGLLVDDPGAVDGETVGDGSFDVGPPDDGGSPADDGAVTQSDGPVEVPGPAIYFARIPAGKPLPDEATCAARVRRTGHEVRPDNAPYNKVAPTAAQLAKVSPFGSGRGFDNAALPMGKRLTGDFAGTTDEILQWAACKWGFDEDFVRADAYQHNQWHQGELSAWTSNTSLCPMGGPIRAGANGQECAQVFSLFGITWQYHPSSWPMMRESTAYAVDYALGLQRVCFEGWVTYMKGWGPAGKMYGPNDEFGCAAWFFTGGWYDFATMQQVSHIKDTLAGRPWLAGP
jgi:hypothetical protein